MGIPTGVVMLASFRGEAFRQRIILTHTYVCVVPTDVDRTNVQVLDYYATKLSASLPAVSLLNDYLATLPNEYLCGEVRVQFVFPFRSAFYALNTAIRGRFEGVANTANTASAITLRTDEGTRRGVATKHVGPMSAESFVSGVITDQQNAANIGLKNGLLRVLNGDVDGYGRFAPCIWHRNPKPGQTATSLITGGVIQQTARVQRRRTVGLGE